MTIGQIFGTPIAVEKIELDTESLSKFCYEIKKIDSGRTLSNAGGGWQSNDLDIGKYFEENEHYKMFVNNVVYYVGHFAKELGIVPDVRIQNMWINISKNGAYNRIHTHPNSVLSGCFYIKTPKNCGDINFINSTGELMQAYLHSWNLMGDNLHQSPLSHFEWRVPVEENRIILFPSWIQHYVDNNNSNEDRISISFNFAVMDNRMVNK